MVCTSCKTSYNALRNSHDCHNLGAGSICEVGLGWGKVGFCWHSGEGVCSARDRVSRFQISKGWHFWDASACGWTQSSICYPGTAFSPTPQPQPTPPGLKILAQITNPHFENLIKEWGTLSPYPGSATGSADISFFSTSRHISRSKTAHLPPEI